MSDANTYKVREYPLELEATTDGQYFSKGWHPAQEFADEASRFNQEEYDGVGYYEAHEVRYDVWRCVPAGPDEGCYVWFFPAQLGTPGAFPVTKVGG